MLRVGNHSYSTRTDDLQQQHLSFLVEPKIVKKQYSRINFKGDTMFIVNKPLTSTWWIKRRNKKSLTAVQDGDLRLTKKELRANSNSDM